MWPLSIIAAFVTLLLLSTTTTTTLCQLDPQQPTTTTAAIRIELTISARQRHLEITWHTIAAAAGARSGHIFLTAAPVPLATTRFHRVPDPSLIEEQYYAESTTTLDAALSVEDAAAHQLRRQKISHHQQHHLWASNTPHPVLYALHVNESRGWHTTDVPYVERGEPVDANSTDTCYGYWATFVPDDDAADTGRHQTCLRTAARWQRSLRPHIDALRLGDLFIVGTHDTGSYRAGFDPRRNETRVTKYTLTQDADVRTQLAHGVRYLDIRVGSYRRADAPLAVAAVAGVGAQRRRSVVDADGADDLSDGDHHHHEPHGGREFWVNHGISRVQLLDDVLRDVRRFVRATGELVIFDVQEWPVGFDGRADRHRALVYHLQRALRDVLVRPGAAGWSATMAEMWRSVGGGGGVVVSYDLPAVVEEFADVVFESVQQRWGDVQTVAALRRHLAPAPHAFRILHRPIAEMAELTPTVWDVFSDRFGGLRRMADETNRLVSEWYRAPGWGRQANIVAVDFVRGTTLMATAMRWNRVRLGLELAEDGSDENGDEH